MYELNLGPIASPEPDSPAVVHSSANGAGAAADPEAAGPRPALAAGQKESVMPERNREQGGAMKPEETLFCPHITVRSMGADIWRCLDCGEELIMSNATSQSSGGTGEICAKCSNNLDFE
jgi:hypothetical protein